MVISKHRGVLPRWPRGGGHLPRETVISLHGFPARGTPVANKTGWSRAVLCKRPGWIGNASHVGRWGEVCCAPQGLRGRPQPPLNEAKGGSRTALHAAPGLLASPGGGPCPMRGAGRRRHEGTGDALGGPAPLPGEALSAGLSRYESPRRHATPHSPPPPIAPRPFFLLCAQAPWVPPHSVAH